MTRAFCTQVDDAEYRQAVVRLGAQGHRVTLLWDAAAPDDPTAHIDQSEEVCPVHLVLFAGFKGKDIITDDGTDTIGGGSPNLGLCCPAGSSVCAQISDIRRDKGNVICDGRVPSGLEPKGSGSSYDHLGAEIDTNQVDADSLEVQFLPQSNEERPVCCAYLDHSCFAGADVQIRYAAAMKGFAAATNLKISCSTRIPLRRSQRTREGMKSGHESVNLKSSVTAPPAAFLLWGGEKRSTEHTV